MKAADKEKAENGAEESLRDSRGSLHQLTTDGTSGSLPQLVIEGDLEECLVEELEKLVPKIAGAFEISNELASVVSYGAREAED